MQENCKKIARKLLLATATMLLPVVANAAFFSDYVDKVYVNGIELVLQNGDSESSVPDTYYCPLSQSVYEDESRSLEATVQIDCEQADFYSFTFAGVEPDADDKVNLTGINLSDDSYEMVLQLTENSDPVSAVLNFTFLPVVEMTVVEDDLNSDSYTLGTMRVVDPDYATYEDAENANETFYARFKYRGSSSLSHSKKNYAVKTCDSEGSSEDRSFFGFRDDNNWILDAAAADASLMRNRVGMDLWNDFASQPYHVRKGYEDETIYTGTRGRFVEVIMNGSYHGIYCLSEKTDRKQLKVKKLDGETIRGLLYKSASWTNEVLFLSATTAYDNNNREEVWAGYEIKYPDYEDEPIDWEPLYNAINFVAKSTDEDFAAEIEDYIDRVSFDEYWLFIQVIAATDNTGKNMFYFIYNIQKDELLGVAPWDLDLTFGCRYDDDTALGTFTVNSDYNLIDKHNSHNLYNRMKARTDIDLHSDFTDLYLEHRDGVFSPESICERFTDYLDLFEASRADVREAEAWPSYHGNIRSTVEYICDYVTARFEFLDAYYTHGTSSAIEEQEDADTEDTMKVVGSNGSIVVFMDSDAALKVFSLTGTYVGTINVVNGQGSLHGLQTGLYLVGTQKVAVF